MERERVWRELGSCPPAPDGAGIRALVLREAGAACPVARAERVCGRLLRPAEAGLVLVHTLAPRETWAGGAPPDEVLAPFAAVAVRRLRVLLTGSLVLARNGGVPAPVARALVAALRVADPWPFALVLALGLRRPAGTGATAGSDWAGPWPAALAVLRGLVADEVAFTTSLLARQVRDFGEHYPVEDALHSPDGGGAHSTLVRMAAAAIAPRLVLGTCRCGHHTRACSGRGGCRCCVAEHALDRWEALDGAPAARHLRVFLAFAVRGIATTNPRARSGGSSQPAAVPQRHVLYGDAFDRSMLRDYLCACGELDGDVLVTEVEFRRCRTCRNPWERRTPDRCPAVRPDLGPCDTPDRVELNARIARRNLIVLDVVYEPVERVVCRSCLNLFDPALEAGGQACPLCGEVHQMRCATPGCASWRHLTDRGADCACVRPFRVACRGPGCHKRWDFGELVERARAGRTGCESCEHLLLDSLRRATLQRCRTRTVRVLR